jgi:hypothetical protein
MFYQTHQTRTDTETPNGGYREFCRKCNGRGKFIGHTGRVFGDCFACKGVGYKEFKISSGERAQARSATQARKARNEQESFETFAATYPEVWAWIEESRASFEFAAAMYEAIRKYGDLTERQLAACARLTAKKLREAEARAAAAPAVNLDKLMAAFDHALRAGLARPKLRFDGFQCSLPKADSKNAGGVYVKTGGTYLGKIIGGKFLRSRDCDDAKAGAVAEAMADPLKAAVDYGRKTGACSCCGRGLIDPVSVERGIGPICAERFGLAPATAAERRETNERNRREVDDAIWAAEIKPTLISPEGVREAR